MTITQIFKTLQVLEFECTSEEINRGYVVFFYVSEPVFLGPSRQTSCNVYAVAFLSQSTLADPGFHLYTYV